MATETPRIQRSPKTLASSALPTPQGEDSLNSLGAILNAALQLGAEKVVGWSPEEHRLVEQLERVRIPVSELRQMIQGGADPLGDAYCQIRGSEERRGLGQTYTPPAIVKSMLSWAQGEVKPERIIDPGSGSGRFSVAAGRAFPRAQLRASDIDPVATLMTRGSLAAAGYAKRSIVTLGDYRKLSVDPIRGKTLYVGNPPYVRHHQIDPVWKQWLIETATRRGHSVSALAGLHAYFFLATAEHGSPGDVGAFITSSEWLDVNYGSLIRDLLLDGLGGLGVHVLDANAAPFADAATTGVITTFRMGSRPSSIRLRRVKSVGDLGTLGGGHLVSRSRLTEARRWTPFIRTNPKLPEGWIELGELCRVHRGAVTGANATWVTDSGSEDLPVRVLYPTVTRARELFAAGASLSSANLLRSVIDIPADLDVLDSDERLAIERFLRRAKKAGAADGYIARTRRAWWAVGLRQPAPILATYMARRPPTFVRNLADARHINVAHGLYPREPLDDAVLNELARSLRSSVVVGQGRTYAGGLTKFEPKEMERVPVPSLEQLKASA